MIWTPPRPASFVGLLAVALSGCSSPPPPTPKPPPTTTATAAPEPPPPSPQYLLRAGYSRDQHTLLPDGQRVSEQHDGTTIVAQQIASPPLRYKSEVPEHLGSGLLFWSDDALYRASSFTGALQPIARLTAKIASVSYGPDLALVTDRRGDRFAIALPDGRLRDPSPPGAYQVLSGPEGQAVAIIRGGGVLTRAAGANAWRDVTSQLPANRSWMPTASNDDGALRLSLGEDPQAARLVEADGSLSPAASGKASSSAQAPLLFSITKPNELERRTLEQAIDKGIAHSGLLVVVRSRSGLEELDLRTGKTRKLHEETPDEECQYLPAGRELLACCRSKEGITVRSLHGDKWRLEKRLEKRTPPTFAFAAADGTVALTGDCSGHDPKPELACMRQAGGEWVQLSATHDDNLVPTQLVRWIPAADGSAVGVFGQPTGIVHTDSGTFVPFRDPIGSSQLFRIVGELDAKWIASDDGSLRGWFEHGTVQVSERGITEQLGPHLTAMGSFQRRGFGQAADGTFWQTTDLGRNWVQVQGPPTRSKLSPRDIACSPLGCIVGPWLRVGWHPTPPVRRPEPVQAAAAPALPTAPAAATLRCRALAAATAEVAEGDEHRELLGFGAELLPRLRDGAYEGEGFSLAGSWRAHLSARPASPGRREQVTLYFARPFETTGKLTRRPVRLPPRPTGIPIPDYEFFEDFVTVLAAAPIAASGLLIYNPHGLLVVGSGARSRPRTSYGGPQQLVTSAVQDGRGKLSVLAVTEDSHDSPPWSTLWTEERKAWRRRARLPGKAGTLAVAPDGSLAVVYAPKAPPTGGDPAMAYPLSGSPIALAPWSTLAAASAPACEQNQGGYRLVANVSGWLKAALDGKPAVGSKTAIATLRWSAQRVCLEAVEMHHINSDGQDVVARFAGTPAAAKLVFDVGFARHQKLSCELQGP